MKMSAAVPPNVPKESIVDWDFYRPGGSDEDIYLAWKELQDRSPDFVWSPHHGGYWIAMRGEDIEFLQKNHDPFSMRDITLPVSDPHQRILPSEADPPEHADYRALITSWFTPKVIKPMEEDMRKLARDRIDQILPRGSCEFISEFAMHMPIETFLRMVRLPGSDREKLLEWSRESSRTTTPDARIKVFERVRGYLGQVIEERRVSPGNDPFSQIIHGKVFGRSLTEEEIMAMCLTLLFGGLDTVASSMGFVAYFLATSSRHRRDLAEHPDLIPAAVDELLRRFSVVSTTRTLTRDFDYKGYGFKKGEKVYTFPALHGLDERKFARPLEVDFYRGNVIHAAFGAGTHRCPGSFLARAEIRIFIEEWLSQIPDFGIAPAESPVMEAGMVNAIRYLPLTWH